MKRRKLVPFAALRNTETGRFTDWGGWLSVAVFGFACTLLLTSIAKWLGMPGAWVVPFVVLGAFFWWMQDRTPPRVNASE